MKWLLILATALIAVSASAQLASPQQVVTSGEVEIATSAELAPLLSQLAAVFSASHPDAHIVVEPIGSNVAMSKLYTAQADIAVIGRTATDQEAKAFEWIYRKPPAAIPLFIGSTGKPGHSPDIAIIVARPSRLRSISMSELAARFLPGGTGRIVMPDSESGTGRFLRHVLLADANQLDWRRVTELTEKDHRHPEATAHRIAALVARDPSAIGIADATPRKGVRTIPVVGGEALQDRPILAYLALNLRQEAQQFLDYIRSPSARQIIAASPYRVATSNHNTLPMAPDSPGEAATQSR